MKEIYTDELTGSYNRRFMYYWIENEIKRANRFDTRFSLILLDIDDFRYINNNFGHLEGDRVLVKFADFLRSNIREVDSLVRYGGDEFIILMPNSNVKGTVELAQRIIDTLNTTELRNHRIGCSVGFAVFPDDGVKTETLITQADDLMYQAKKQGKNRIGVKQAALRKLRIPSPVIIGRDDETNWCLSQLKEYNTIFIAGEVGIGKTRLVLEIKDRLNTQVVLRGNAYEALSSVPYHPFKNMFNELINKDFALVQQTFKRMSEIYQSEMMKLLPAEGVLRMIQTEELDKYRLYHAVSEFMIKLSESVFPSVTILFMDDVHWADRSTCELLDFVIRSVKNNIKILGTYRVEEIKSAPVANFFGIWAREKLYTQITLSPLNEMLVNQLLVEIMGAVPTPAAKFIYHESGGNPFYIEEILSELSRRKKIYWDGREWIFVRSIEVTIPVSIDETIRRKISMLDPEMMKFLDIVAVYGQEFNPEIPAIASKRNVGQIIDALDVLRRLGFIKYRSPDSFFFSEDIVRQIVYKNISKGDLIQYHKAVGEAIEVVYKNVLSNYYEQLVTHFSIANDSAKALNYAKKAALKAKDNYAHSLAIKFFEQALRYETKIEEIFKINFSLAEIYISIGNYKKALQQLHNCIKIDPNSYRVYEKLGNIHEKIANYKTSLRYYQKGLNMTQGTSGVFIFRTAIAWLYTRLGQYLRAKEECENMLSQKRQMTKQTLGDTYVILGVILLRLGKFNKAELYIRKGLKIRETIGDKKNIAACYVDLGLNYQGKFNIRLSEKFYNKALNIYEEVGYQEGILITLNNLGVMNANYDLPKAEAYCLEALAKAKLIGAKRTIVLLYNNLGTINYNRLMTEQALLSYRQALKFAKEIDFYEGIIFANISLSEFYREKNRLKRGRSHLDTAIRVADEINLKFLNIDCLMEEIEYCMATRQLKKADRLAKKMAVQLKTESNILYKIYSHVQRARILVESEKYKRAHAYYSKALNYVKSLPENKISGEIYYFKGIAHKREGRSKEALKMFIEANRIFKAIGNLRYLDKIEKEIAGTTV